MAEKDEERTPPAAPPSAKERRLMRSAARLAAVQALYRMELTGAGLKSVEMEFEGRWIGAEIEGDRYRDADIDLFRAILRTAVAEQARIDRMTDQALVERWPLGKIDPTLRALFRAAGGEILGGRTPPKVAISEYVDVAKAFFGEGRESRFVNGVLDHVARAVRPEAFAPRA